MDASRLPEVTQDALLLDFAERYAPILLADNREPFSVIAAGYTVFDNEGDSPSFLPRRRVEWIGSRYPAACAVEYALWWDWDIGHLYELEHVWTYVGAQEEVVAVEASWHGLYGEIEIGGRPPLEGTHPILLAQPGKHAMAATIDPFFEVRQWAEEEAGPKAGKDGVLDNGLFAGQLGKTPEQDARVSTYLRKLQFCPSWEFGKRMPVVREMLVPWADLKSWIPSRVAWWLNRI